MNRYLKFKWVFRLLKTKEGRRVLFIPIIIMIAFSGYTIYQMEINPKPEIIEMQDGSGDIRLTRRSELTAFKLPKEVGEIRDIIGEDVKVIYYDVLCDKENHIKSALVSIKTDEASAQDIIASYKSKYDSKNSAGGYDMQIHYDKYNHRIDIELKK